MLTEQEVMNQLRTAVERAGGQRRFAELHKLTPGYLNDVLHGKRALADRILATIGITRHVVYQVTYQQNGPQNGPQDDVVSHAKDAPFEAS